MDTKRVKPSQPNLQHMHQPTPEALAITKAFRSDGDRATLDTVDAAFVVPTPRDLPDQPVTMNVIKARPVADSPMHFDFDLNFARVFGDLK